MAGIDFPPWRRPAAEDSKPLAAVERARRCHGLPPRAKIFLSRNRRAPGGRRVSRQSPSRLARKRPEIFAAAVGLRWAPGRAAFWSVYRAMKKSSSWESAATARVGIGVICGRASGGLVAIDVDVDEVVDAVTNALPHSPAWKVGAKGINAVFPRRRRIEGFLSKSCRWPARAHGRRARRRPPHSSSHRRYIPILGRPTDGPARPRSRISTFRSCPSCPQMRSSLLRKRSSHLAIGRT